MPSQYKTSLLRSIKLLVTTLALPISLLQVNAQQTNSSESDSGTPAPLVKPARSTNVPDDDDIVQLSKFTVSTTKKEDGYRATDTLAGTRLKSDLKDVAASISVVTTKFLQDTGAKDNQSLLQYTANTEVGSIGGNFAGVGGQGTNLQGIDWGAMLNPNQNTRVRGLMSADNSRDYMLSQIPWDSYNVDRVDLQRGPNSILFGLGSPAGLINVSTKQAGYADKGEVGFQFGSYGSNRLTMDFNKVLLAKQLSIRFDMLNDDTEYRQDPAYNHDRRFYGALRFDPKFLDRNGMHTTLRVNYEHAEISANRPNYMPPVDQITPWFQTGTNSVTGYANLNKGTYDGMKNNEPEYPIYPDTTIVPPAGTTPQYGTTKQGTTYYQPWLGTMGTLYSNTPAAIFANPNSNSPASLSQTANNMTFNTLSPDNLKQGQGLFPYYIPMGITDYRSYATNAGLPNADIAPYYDKSMTDSSIFDFWNNLLSGPNNNQWQCFDVATVNLNQTFFNNRVGVEFVYDNQRYKDGMTNGLDWNVISVDINRTLADGSPNPNLGRPFVEGSNIYGNASNTDKRETYRLTAFAELNFSDFLQKDSPLARALGRHVFTVFGSIYDQKTEQRQWVRQAFDMNYIYALGAPDASRAGDIQGRTRTPASITYIGPSLLDPKYTTASGLHLSGITAQQQYSNSMPMYYFDSNWKKTSTEIPSNTWTHIQVSGSNSGQTIIDTQSNNPENYVGWITQSFNMLRADNPNDLGQLYFSGKKTETRLKSYGAVWQGFLLDGTVVPTFGFRQDWVNNPQLGGASAYVDPVTGVANMNYQIAQIRYLDPFNSHTFGVVLHMPKSIIARMPLKTEVSLFAYDGQNYQVGSAAVDIYGKPLDMPKGRTQEYGFLINTLNSRASFKMTWYDTKVQNARLGASLNTYMLGRVYSVYFVEAMREQTGLNQRNMSDTDPAKVFPNTPSSNQNYIWDWSGNSQKMAAHGNSQQAVWDAEQASLNAFFGRPIDTAFCQAWNINVNGDGWKYSNNIPSTTPVGLDATSDQQAKGIEIEFTARPVDGLDITFNASKNTAQRVNVGGVLKTWVDSVNAWLNEQNGAGDLGLWYGSNGDTIRNNWNSQFMAGYNLLKQLEGTDVPELRPWRFNLVANYAVQKTWLKGLSFGGGYRWEDKIILGYPVGDDGFYDLSKPYKGSAENHFDFWIGYSRKITRQIEWRIQLNVRDAFAKKELIPVTIQSDGTSAGYRIPALTTWQLSNTLSF